jgi:sugar lactone lactonase YvrE
MYSIFRDGISMPEYIRHPVSRVNSDQNTVDLIVNFGGSRTDPAADMPSVLWYRDGNFIAESQAVFVSKTVAPVTGFTVYQYWDPYALPGGNIASSTLPLPTATAAIEYSSTLTVPAGSSTGLYRAFIPILGAYSNYHELLQTPGSAPGGARPALQVIRSPQDVFRTEGSSAYLWGDVKSHGLPLFRYPYGVAVDAEGFTYVTDTENHSIRRVMPGGYTETVAGIDGQPFLIRGLDITLGTLTGGSCASVTSTTIQVDSTRGLRTGHILVPTGGLISDGPAFVAGGTFMVKSVGGDQRTVELVTPLGRAVTGFTAAFKRDTHGARSQRDYEREPLWGSAKNLELRNAVISPGEKYVTVEDISTLTKGAALSGAGIKEGTTVSDLSYNTVLMTQAAQTSNSAATLFFGSGDPVLLTASTLNYTPTIVVANTLSTGTSAAFQLTSDMYVVNMDPAKIGVPTPSKVVSVGTSTLVLSGTAFGGTATSVAGGTLISLATTAGSVALAGVNLTQGGSIATVLSPAVPSGWSKGWFLEGNGIPNNTTIVSKDTGTLRMNLPATVSSSALVFGGSGVVSGGTVLLTAATVPAITLIGTTFFASSKAIQVATVANIVPGMFVESGTAFPPGTRVASVSGAGTIYVTNPATSTGLSNTVVVYSAGPAIRAQLTQGSTTASIAMTDSIAGLGTTTRIYGTGIPAGTNLSSVTTNVVMSGTATATIAGGTIVTGYRPVFSAPLPVQLWTGTLLAFPQYTATVSEIQAVAGRQISPGMRVYNPGISNGTTVSQIQTSVTLDNAALAAGTYNLAAVKAVTAATGKLTAGSKQVLVTQGTSGLAPGMAVIGPGVLPATTIDKLPFTVVLSKAVDTSVAGGSVTLSSPSAGKITRQYAGAFTDPTSYRYGTGLTNDQILSTGTEPLFDSPEGVTTADNLHVYVADTGNNAIRRIHTDTAGRTIVDSISLTFTKSDTVGSKTVVLNRPRGIVFYGSLNNPTPTNPPALYIVDSVGLWRLALDSNGSSIIDAAFVGTLNSNAQTLLPNSAIEQPINRVFSPRGLAVTDGGKTVFVADTIGHVIRRVTLNYDYSFKQDEIVAGQAGLRGSVDGKTGFYPLKNLRKADENVSRLAYPSGLALDANQNLYFTEMGSHRVRRVVFDSVNAEESARVESLLGSGLPGPLDGSVGDGTGAAASFWYPATIAFDNTDPLNPSFVVADSANHAIRRITPVLSSGTGIVSGGTGTVSGGTGTVSGGTGTVSSGTLSTTWTSTRIAGVTGVAGNRDFSELEEYQPSEWKRFGQPVLNDYDFQGRASVTRPYKLNITDLKQDDSGPIEWQILNLYGAAAVTAQAQFRVMPNTPDGRAVFVEPAYVSKFSLTTPAGEQELGQHRTDLGDINLTQKALISPGDQATYQWEVLNSGTLNGTTGTDPLRIYVNDITRIRTGDSLATSGSWSAASPVQPGTKVLQILPGTLNTGTLVLSKNARTGIADFALQNWIPLNDSIAFTTPDSRLNAIIGQVGSSVNGDLTSVSGAQTSTLTIRKLQKGLSGVLPKVSLRTLSLSKTIIAKQKDARENFLSVANPVETHDEVVTDNVTWKFIPGVPSIGGTLVTTGSFSTSLSSSDTATISVSGGTASISQTGSAVISGGTFGAIMLDSIAALSGLDASQRLTGDYLDSTVQSKVFTKGEVELSRGQLTEVSVAAITGSFTSQGGTLTVEGAARLVTSGGSLTSSGAQYFNAAGGAVTLMGGSYSTTGGTYTTDGGVLTLSGGSLVNLEDTFRAYGGTFTILGGTYSVTGGTVNAVGATYGMVGGTYAAIGGTLEVQCGTLVIQGGTVESFGYEGSITASGSVVETSGGTAILLGGTLTVTGGTVTGSGILSAPTAVAVQPGRYGIYETQGEVSIQASFPPIFGDDSRSTSLEDPTRQALVFEPAALLQGGSYTTTGGTVNASGSTLIGTLTGGNVTATGGTVNTSGGSVTVTGGSVTVTGGSVTVTGGTVTVTGGVAFNKGGVVTNSGDSIIITGGTVTASGGSVTALGGMVQAVGALVTASNGVVEASEATLSSDFTTVTATGSSILSKSLTLTVSGTVWAHPVEMGDDILNPKVALWHRWLRRGTGGTTGSVGTSVAGTDFDYTIEPFNYYSELEKEVAGSSSYSGNYYVEAWVGESSVSNDLADSKRVGGAGYTVNNSSKGVYVGFQVPPQIKSVSLDAKTPAFQVVSLKDAGTAPVDLTVNYEARGVAEERFVQHEWQFIPWSNAIVGGVLRPNLDAYWQILATAFVGSESSSVDNLGATCTPTATMTQATLRISDFPRLKTSDPSGVYRVVLRLPSTEVGYAVVAQSEPMVVGVRDIPVLQDVADNHTVTYGTYDQSFKADNSKAPPSASNPALRIQNPSVSAYQVLGNLVDKPALQLRAKVLLSAPDLQRANMDTTETIRWIWRRDGFIIRSGDNVATEGPVLTIKQAGYGELAKYTLKVSNNVSSGEVDLSPDGVDPRAGGGNFKAWWLTASSEGFVLMSNPTARPVNSGSVFESGGFFRVALGQSAVMEVPVSSNSGKPLTFDWRKVDGTSKRVIVSGNAVSSTRYTHSAGRLVIKSVALADAGQYEVVIKAADLSGQSQTTTMKLFVEPVPDPAAPASSSVNYYAGSPVTLSAKRKSTGKLFSASADTKYFTYQWRKNGVPISGEIRETLTIGALSRSNSGQYTVSVTGVAGTRTSAPLSFSVNDNSPKQDALYPVTMTNTEGAYHLIFPALSSGSLTAGTKVSINSFARTGKSLLGWNVFDANGGITTVAPRGGQFIMPASPVTISASMGRSTAGSYSGFLSAGRPWYDDQDPWSQSSLNESVSADDVKGFFKCTVSSLGSVSGTVYLEGKALAFTSALTPDVYGGWNAPFQVRTTLKEGTPWTMSGVLEVNTGTTMEVTDVTGTGNLQKVRTPPVVQNPREFIGRSVAGFGVASGATVIDANYAEATPVQSPGTEARALVLTLSDPLRGTASKRSLIVGAREAQTDNVVHVRLNGAVLQQIRPTVATSQTLWSIAAGDKAAYKVLRDMIEEDDSTLTIPNALKYTAAIHRFDRNLDYSDPNTPHTLGRGGVLSMTISSLGMATINGYLPDGSKLSYSGSVGRAFFKDETGADPERGVNGTAVSRFDPLQGVDTGDLVSGETDFINAGVVPMSKTLGAGQQVMKESLRRRTSSITLPVWAAKPAGDSAAEPFFGALLLSGLRMDGCFGVLNQSKTNQAVSEFTHNYAEGWIYDPVVVLPNLQVLPFTISSTSQLVSLGPVSDSSSYPGGSGSLWTVPLLTGGTLSGGTLSGGTIGSQMLSGGTYLAAGNFGLGTLLTMNPFAGAVFGAAFGSVAAPTIDNASGFFQCTLIENTGRYVRRQGEVYAVQGATLASPGAVGTAVGSGSLDSAPWAEGKTQLFAKVFGVVIQGDKIPTQELGSIAFKPGIVGFLTRGNTAVNLKETLGNDPQTPFVLNRGTKVFTTYRTEAITVIPNEPY